MVRSCLVAITSECLDQANQVLLRSETANRQEERSGRQALPSLGMVVPEVGLVPVERVINGVVAQSDAIGRHPQIDQVVTMVGTSHERRVEQAQPTPFDQLLPPGSRPVDRLTL